MKRFIIFFLLFIAPVTYSQLEAQVLTEEAAREEIRKRGLDEEEVIREIEKRGINLAELDINNPSQLARAETVVRQVIAELEAKKANPGGAIDTTQIPLENLTKQESKEAAQGSEEVIDAIEEGATLEEAVSETLQENAQAKLPPTGVYGKDIFRNKVLKEYRRADNAKAPGTYILGPGDKVAINIWGISEFSGAFEISNDGYIKPELMPRIFLNGLSIDQAKEKLRSSFSRHYRFEQSSFDVTLSVARTITVNIVGEVETPGSYTISALNTAFNALMAAGGPNQIGSVRNIQLLRGGEVLEVDVYEFLQNPSVSQNMYLQENSYINVPVAQKVVTISGAVRRPMRYELKQNEGLNTLIGYAGGLKDLAVRKNIQVTRIENDDLKLVDVNFRKLSNSNRDFLLLPGDRVEVRSLRETLENVVNIVGAVNQSGEYALEAGMRVSDLLAKTELRRGAILDSAYLKRTNQDNITVKYLVVNLQDIIENPASQQNLLLQDKDQLIIRSIDQYTDAYTVEISGAVRSPGSFPFAKTGTLRISDLVFLAKGLTENAATFGYIYRKSPNSTKGLVYQEVDLTSALSDPGGVQDLILRGGDRLQILSKSLYEDEFEVTIGGAVRKPGTFLFDPSLRIADVIKLAGGFTLEASPSRVEIYRIDLSGEGETKTLAAQLKIGKNMEIQEGKDFPLMPYDRIYVRNRPEFELQRMVTIQGEVKYPGTYAILDDNEKLASIIKRAGGLTDESFLGGSSLFRSRDNVGYIILDFAEALENSASPENAIIQAGDVISIPKMENLVTILGATRAAELYPDEQINGGKFTVPYIDGKNAKFYIDEYAGGIADNGDPGKVSVNYANGEIKEAGRFLLWRTYPEVRVGSEIRIGYKDIKVEKPDQERQDSDVDWGEVLSDSVAQALSVLTLVLLLQRID